MVPFVPRFGVVMDFDEVVVFYNAVRTSLVLLDAIVANNVDLDDDLTVFGSHKEQLRRAIQALFSIRQDLREAFINLNEIVTQRLSQIEE